MTRHDSDDEREKRLALLVPPEESNTPVPPDFPTGIQHRCEECGVLFVTTRGQLTRADKYRGLCQHHYARAVEKRAVPLPSEIPVEHARRAPITDWNEVVRLEMAYDSLLMKLTDRDALIARLRAEIDSARGKVQLAHDFAECIKRFTEMK